MSDGSRPSRAEAIARAVGAALGTLAGKSARSTEARQDGEPLVKHRLPRKLKKAFKKA